MKFLVRSATEDDAPCACDVVRSSIIECCHEDHHGDVQVLEQWLRNKTYEFVRGVIAAPNAFSVVACLETKIVGFASALETGEMTLCYVTPSVRFKGVGKALLAAIEEQAVQAGGKTLRLESTNTAREFYLRNGFISEGQEVTAFGMKGLPMRKKLRQKLD